MVPNFDFLQKVDLFSGVDASILENIANDFRQRRYRKGEIIFHQGDETRHFFVIVDGLVRVYHLTPGGEETTVNIFSHGQLLGEIALVDNEPRSATAQAIGNCTVLEMSSTQAIEYLTNVPGLGLAMCREITKKLRWTTMYAEAIARYDTAGRLLHFLLLFNQQFGQELDPGVRYQINLGLNQSDLASLVGAKRGWINTKLGQWRQRNLLEFNKGQITILDLPRVEAERDSLIAF